ncbi:hypothetical protein SPRG_10605 [Saprolegnia parasitica CBS 223.65]|uniref:Poly [ADP-ribose] polymerase n=1 Tax=Saprolegnia parasitica (strain CBS 223.65) TaxID=695850 RepID=A0A067CBM9_SAPPC|nr:hypothetical protein SPRG_10605 [Saprolegnia parasitica CBS 223.65]KDO24177.1 hypothetical protein SPRG_10605 [Saprolegnia parasitica CBS 223.65]|eukprot:XP_012205121.1 hypothetical protein SPRG_10605 [Saprolegnia parasitica CBS 223.65]
MAKSRKTTKSKAMKRKAPPPPPVAVHYDDDSINTLFEAMSVVAVRCDDDERFYVAELLDDTTEEMLDDDSATVNVLYYDKQPDGSYVVGAYDVAPVRAIMCEVALEAKRAGTYALPARHAQRVQRVLDAVEAGNGVPEEETQPIKKRKTKASSAVEDDDDDATMTTMRSRASPKSAKLKIDKKSGLARCIVHVATDVADDEMAGDHSFRAKCHDVLASAKEVLRAVLTRNYDLLASLLTPDAAAKMHTLHAARSVGVRKTALQYAIEHNDTQALLLFQGIKETKWTFAAKPKCALQSLGTGQHTSAYSDYNRRAINASRGGKEGLNALLKDLDLDTMGDAYPFVDLDRADLSKVLWSSPNTTYELVAFFYPADAWVSNAETVMPRVFRCGNVALATKLLGILVARSGWGYNALHLGVLSDAPLEPFRKVSVLKKATGHGIAPLHVASLDPAARHLGQLVAELSTPELEFADRAGWHAVHYAAVCSSSAPMRILLDAGANATAKTTAKETPLHWASSFGRAETVKLLLESMPAEMRSGYLEGLSPNGFRALHIAAVRGHAAVVTALLDAGAELNAATASNHGKLSALALAAEAGHADVVDVLLRARAPVDIRDKLRRTPLILAVMNGYSAVATTLLNAGADANAADTSLNTVMHYAASYGWRSCVRLLHSVGAEAWSRNDWGYTPMACAALKGRYDVSRFLIDHATDPGAIDFVDANGASMLFLQCQLAESTDELTFLLEKGADPNRATMDECTPIQQVLQRLATSEEATKPALLAMLTLLLKHGATVDGPALKKHGQPLSLAMRAQSKPAFDLLLPTTTVTAATWFVAVTSGAEFVEALLAASKGMIPLDATPYHANLLHALASSPTSLPIAVVSAVVARLDKAAFTACDHGGDTPVAELLLFQRPMHIDVHRDDDASDAAYMALLELYLQHTPDLARLRRMQTLTKEKKADEEVWAPSTMGLLHMAAARKLATTSDGPRRWRGKDVLATLLSFGAWTQADVDALDDDESPLLVAAKHGHVDGARALIDIGANVNYCVPIKPATLACTPLHAALHCLPMVQLLLENGADASFAAIATPKNTPLHVAVDRRNTELVDLLLSFGANAVLQNELGFTPLTAAVAAGLSVEQTLLHANDVDYTTTVQQGDDWDFACHKAKPVEAPPARTVVSALIRETTKAAIPVPDAQGRTSLHYACKKRDIHLLRCLLALSSDAINVTDVDGRTPLHFAVNAAPMTPEATFDVESLLLQHGADVNAVDRFGLSVLHFAFVKVNLDWHHEHKSLSHAEMVKQHEAHLTAIPRTESDPIETVGSLCLVDGLVVTGQDVLGRTPLHLGAATGAVVSVLGILHLAPKTILHVTDTRGDTALGRAMAHERKAMVTTLIQHGSSVHGTFTVENPSMEKKRKASYYFFAVQQKWQGICHLLLQSGYCRRQAVEDSIRTHNWELTSNLITSLVNSSDRVLQHLNDRGETLLHILAAQDVEFTGAARAVAWQLIDAGVSASALDKSGASVLHAAAPHAHLEALCFYLHHAPTLLNATMASSGASPVVHGLRTVTNVDLATKLVVFFKRRGADLSLRANDGHSVVSLLLDRFSNNNSTDATRLLFLLQLLLAAGVSPSGRFPTSHPLAVSRHASHDKLSHATPLLRTLYVTSGYLRQHLLTLLLAHGADITETDTDGNSCLAHAAMRNLTDEAKFLVGKSVAATIERPLVATDKTAANTETSEAAQDNNVSGNDEDEDDDSASASGSDEDMGSGSDDDDAEEEEEAEDEPMAAVEEATEAKTTDTEEVVVRRPPIVVRRKLPAAALRKLVGLSNAFGENALHVAVYPRHGMSFENTLLVQLLKKSGVSTTATDVDGRTPLDLAKTQPSGVLWTALTSTPLPSIGDAPSFVPQPAVDDDALAFLAYCEAHGHVVHEEITPEVAPQCEAGNNPSVLVDADKVAYAVVLTKVDVQSGQHGVNVFYRMQVVHNPVQDVYILFTNWGRIGEDGKYQHTPFPDAVNACNEFKKIFKSKTSNVFPPTSETPFTKKPGKYMLCVARTQRAKYDIVVTSPIQVPSDAPPSVHAPPVQDALAAITDFNCLHEAAKHLSLTDVPLVELQSHALQQALQQLHEIHDMIVANDKVLSNVQNSGGLEPAALAALTDEWRAATEAIAAKCSRYFECVPRDDATAATELAAFLDVASVQKEMSRVRQLIEIAGTSKIVLGAKARAHERHPLDYCYDALQVQLRQSSVAEVDAVRKYYVQGHCKSGYSVANVFTLDRRDELDRDADTDVPGHRTLLWHGTKRTNLMSILHRGLCIAPADAPRTGLAFGKGVYFADAAAKSLQYCTPFTTADKKKTKVYLLLCDVALGTPHRVQRSEYRESAADGTHSTFAVGSTQPDPSETLVVAATGRSKVPLGDLKVLGTDLPRSFVWYAKQPKNENDRYFSNRTTLCGDTAALLERFAQGTESHLDVTEPSELLEGLLVYYNYYGQFKTPTKVSVDAVARQRWVSGALHEAHLRLTVHFTADEDTFSFDAIGRTDVFDDAEAPTGYSLQMDTSSLSYSEFIVYKERQVRMRYLVELELETK